MAILKPRRPRRNTTATVLMTAAIGGVGVSTAVAHPVQTWPDTVSAEVVARIGSAGLDDEAEEYILGDVTSVAADEQGAGLRRRWPSAFCPCLQARRGSSWSGSDGRAKGPASSRGVRSTSCLPEMEGSWCGASVSPPLRAALLRNTRIPSSAHGAFRPIPAPLPGGLDWPTASTTTPDYQARGDEPVRYFYVKYGPGGLPGDTVQVPAVGNLSRQFTAFYMINRGSGRLVPGLNIAPFAPRADWDMTGLGTIIVSDGETYQLQEFDQDGQLLRTIDGPELERRAVPPAERADSMRALEARIDSLPVSLDEVEHVAPEILRGEIPDSLPPLIAIHVGASDRIWVERWPLEGMASSRYYDVLEYDGRYAGTVVVPAPLLADPPPFFGEDIIVGVVMDPTTDVHSVVALRFRLPE